jgi:hypothetical protein
MTFKQKLLGRCTKIYNNQRFVSIDENAFVGCVFDIPVNDADFMQDI